MKIEIHLNGPQTVAWLKSTLDAYAAAAEADRNALDAKFNEQWERAAETSAAVTAETLGQRAQPAEAEKPKATRSRKAKDDVVEVLKEAVAEGKTEPAAQITTNPEDRKPVEEIEVAEIVTETVDLFDETPAAPAKVYTRDDVKVAMQAYVAKHGMDKLAANAADLLGAPKLSSIPDDPAAFKAAVERLEAANG